MALREVRVAQAAQVGLVLLVPLVPQGLREQLAGLVQPVVALGLLVQPEVSAQREVASEH